MPLQETSGASSYDAFGGGAAAVPIYIEDVFSTFLYTGNGATRTITNGIDLSGRGGLVWLKVRSSSANHFLFDTARGVLNEINSNTTDAQASLANSLTAFNATGFTLGGATGINQNTVTMASWTFREQSKFFDVVTYTGDGANRTIAHNLGSVPGCIMVKRTDTTAAWAVYHRSLANTQYMVLNTTAAAATGATWWNSTTPTSTEFSLGTDTTVNASGGTYVAYLFAHDAGGFGLTGADNVISCGSFTTNGSGNASVTLGYEPQWLMYKRSSGTDNWTIVDNMRGWFSSTQVDANLIPNLAAGEPGTLNVSDINATGFTVNALSASSNFIYIVIRRGPMKVPTSGTQVYEPLTNQPASGGLFSHNILTDFSFYHWQNGTQNWGVQDRLRGSPDLSFNSTSAENGLIGGNSWAVMTGYINTSPGAGAYTSWAFRRAPGFMDVVCYTGDGVTTRDLNHNLGAIPTFLITKSRSAAGNWAVACLFSSGFYITGGDNGGLALNTDRDVISSASTPFTTTTTYRPDKVGGGFGNTNVSGTTYVSYLFGNLAGISYAGVFTGSGATQVINCGFTSGARFILIKARNAVDGWYLWDSARGIVAGNDPYILLNSGVVSVTGTDYVDTAATGFELSNAAGNPVNVASRNYIFLAIA